jgi:catechol 2,3-dioxygenase-like lactoylglutathione lyase family enzyme
VKLLGRVNVVSLTVTDLAQAREFYGTTLGLGEPWFDSDKMGWVEWGQDGQDGNLAVTLARDGLAPGGGTTPVLNTPDCHTLYEALRRQGVRCEPPAVIPGLLTYCTFYDPDGNRLQAIGPPPADTG